jgi:hypothetical protein
MLLAAGRSLEEDALVEDTDSSRRRRKRHSPKAPGLAEGWAVAPVEEVRNAAETQRRGDGPNMATLRQRHDGGEFLSLGSFFFSLRARTPSLKPSAGSKWPVYLHGRKSTRELKKRSLCAKTSLWLCGRVCSTMWTYLLISTALWRSRARLTHQPATLYVPRQDGPQVRRRGGHLFWSTRSFLIGYRL